MSDEYKPLTNDELLNAGIDLQAENNRLREEVRLLLAAIATAREVLTAISNQAGTVAAAMAPPPKKNKRENNWLNSLDWFDWSKNGERGFSAVEANLQRANDIMAESKREEK